jgi:SAM-dependent methyltransferase
LTLEHSRDPIGPGYNERLLTRPGLRRAYHLARFDWTARKIRELVPGTFSLIELGCFDGRLLSHLDAAVERYVGIDANWEGGLDLARKQYRGRPDIQFIESASPSTFDRFGEREFDCAASLETLEHIPVALLPGFLDEIARVTDGYFFVTVPNELGPVFLAKYLAKKLIYGDTDPYSFREIVAATLRRSDRVERAEHKGFDYRDLAKALARRFDIVSVESVFPRRLPPPLALTVGIVARARVRAAA